MVRIGIVGLGFMGMVHYLAYGEAAGCEVVALCSRDARKLDGDWTGIQGNFGPSGTNMDLSRQVRYTDYVTFLADPNMALVDLCVASEAHARMAIQALEAGKHVLVEKPIALSMEDADRMLAAADANARHLMVAHVLPFFPPYAFALEAVRSGRYGRLQAAHLTRVIARAEDARPVRHGGPALDLHIHDTHYVGLLSGTPRGVRSIGVSTGGAVSYLSTQYLYDEPVAVSAVSGALSQRGRSFAHGFELFLEGATLAHSFANLAGVPTRTCPLSVILPDGRVEQPTLAGDDPMAAFKAELSAAVAGIATGSIPSALEGTRARAALALCQAEIESVRTGTMIPLNHETASGRFEADTA